MRGQEEGEGKHEVHEGREAHEGATFQDAFQLGDGTSDPGSPLRSGRGDGGENWVQTDAACFTARPAPALRCFAAPAGVTELGGSVQNSMRTRAPPAP